MSTGRGWLGELINLLSIYNNGNYILTKTLSLETRGTYMRLWWGVQRGCITRRCTQESISCDLSFYYKKDSFVSKSQIHPSKHKQTQNYCLLIINHLVGSSSAKSRTIIGWGRVHRVLIFLLHVLEGTFRLSFLGINCQGERPGRPSLGL